MTSGSAPQPPQLGDFVLHEVIARGGMGTVHRGWQLSLDRPVAIKVLHEEFAQDESFVERFQQEARSAARLLHPNIIQIYAVGCEQDTHYFAMEFVEGRSLRQELRERERLSVVEALDCVIKIADALDCAATAGIIHRDIKPENIMLTPSGRVKVADFGLAKSFLAERSTQLTRDGRVFGTVAYMAPEQGLGKAIDHRSDIYSLGVMFFELLTGRTPFRGDHPTSIIYMHVYEPPPPVRQHNRSVPKEIEDLVRQTMAKDPADRPQSPRQLIERLEEVRDRCGFMALRPGRRSSQQMISTIDPKAPTVLVIEDDADVAALCRLVLAGMGVNSVVASDGVEGLEVWRRIRPDIVLLDLMMPNLSGMAVLEERSNGRLGGSVLITSAVSDRQVIQRAADYGASGYLLKPFSAKELQARVEKLLLQRRESVAGGR